MKNGKLKRITRRAVSMLLAALTVLPVDLLSLSANAAPASNEVMKPISTTWTKFVVWDFIEDMQELGQAGVDYHPSNETHNIDVGDTKYSRILFYQNVGNDYYYFNASPTGGPKKGDGLTTYYEDQITLDATSRLGNAANSEWANDMLTAQMRALTSGNNATERIADNKRNPKSFVTKGGLRTPYLQYGGTKEGYETWRLWVANEDDSCSNSALCLVDDYENLDIRLTTGFDDHQHHYGADNKLYRCDPWIIDKHFVIACAANFRTTEEFFSIWHWDNDSGGINEALNFDLSGRRIWADNVRSKAELENFMIFLGKEYKVGTLAEDFTVQKNQAQTLGKPLYYIPKGRTITVKSDAVLTIDGVVFNDGEIVVEDGGLLVVKDGAKLMPFTKMDTACGKITNYGSIVVGEDALLCGGSTNGVRILRGGVVNFGVIAGESMYAAEDYSIDNRDTGWVIAGRSPSSEARARYVQEAIKDEAITPVRDPDKEFTKVGPVNSTYNFLANSIYGNTVNVRKYGDAAIGSANDPKLTVMVRETPNDAYKDLFTDASLDNVSLRVSGNKATYTVTKGTVTTPYVIDKKLVAAYIARGSKDREQLFTDLWVGPMEDGYFQLEPVCAEGFRLSLNGGSTNNNTPAVIRKADTGMDQWWHITKKSTTGVNTSYYIDNVKSKNVERGLDIAGKNNVSRGATVQLYDHSDNGDDQRWLLVQNYSNEYFIRNASNTGVSLAVSGGRAADNTPVNVQENSTYESAQYWRIANLFSEDAYSAAVDFGTAVELIPQKATTMRLAVADARATASGGINAAIRTDDVVNNAQRWRLEAVGTDDLSGEATVYYRIVEMTTDLALTVYGTEAREGAYVTTAASQSGDSGRLQYWYLQTAPGGDTYYLAPRSNSSLVLTAPDSENPPSGSRLTLSRNLKTENQRWKISGVEAAMAAAEAAAEEEKIIYSTDPLSGTVIELEPVMEGMKGWRLIYTSDNVSGDWLGIRYSEISNPTDRWRLKYIDTDEAGDYYQLVSMNDKEAAYVNFAGTNAKRGLVLKQNADKDKTSQQWYVSANEDGTYTFRCRDNTDITMGVRKETDNNTNAVDYFPCFSPDNYSTNIRSLGLRYDYYVVNWKLIPEPYAALDGKTYTLAPMHVSGMAAGVQGKSDDSNANVELQTADEKDLYQQWTFQRAGSAELNGEQAVCYTITNEGSGKVFDLPDKGGESGQNVAQSSPNGGVDQQWFAVLNEDETYTFVNRSNNKIVLAVQDAGTTAGANIQVSTGDGADAQKWTLTPATKVDRFDGKVFYLSPKHAGTNKVLDLVGNGNTNGTKVQLYNKAETEIQRWRFELSGYTYVEGKKVNYYRIHSVYAPGKVLDNSGSTANGARPHLWDGGADNKNQDWIVQSAGDGYYYICSRSDTNEFLGAAGGKTDNNTAVELWNSKGENRQWKFTETIAPETVGTYSILPKHAPGMHVGLSSSDNSNGTKLIIWEYNETSNYARWTFVKMGTDSGGAYYKIVNMASGKVIDAVGQNAIQADSQLQQWDSDFYSDQLWYLNDAGQDENGLQYYNIVNRSDTNYCMSVSGGSTVRGTGVTVAKKNGSDSQKFRLMERFEPVTLGTYEFGSPTALDMRLNVVGGISNDGTNINLYTRHDNTVFARQNQHQRFKIVLRGTDLVNGESKPYYSIENVGSGKVLDPTGNANVSNGTNINQWAYDGYSDQHWYMEVYGDGSVTFHNRADSNYVLETTGTSNNSNVQLGRLNSKGSANQRWLLYQVMETTSDGRYIIPGNQAAVDAGIPNASAEDTVIDPGAMGRYTIAPAYNNFSLRMDLPGGYADGNNIIQVYDRNGGANQKWEIVPKGVDYYDGQGRVYYSIYWVSRPDKLLQCEGNGPVWAGLNFYIQSDEGTYDDYWYFEPVGSTDVDGDEETLYQIIGRGTMTHNTKSCVQAPDKGGSGTKLNIDQVRTGNKYTYQRWVLFPTS